MVVCSQVFPSFFLLFLGCTVSTPSSSRLSNPGLEVILIKIAESWTCFRSQVWKHAWGRYNQNSRDHQSPIFMEKVALLMKRGRKDPDGQSVCIQNLNLFCIHCCLEIFLFVSSAVFFVPSWVAFSVNLLHHPLPGNFVGVFFFGLLSLYKLLNASLVAYTFCCVEILLFVLIAVFVVHVSCIQSLNLLLHLLLPASRFLFVSIIAHLFSAVSCIQSESVVTSTAAWRFSCSFQLLVCFVSWVAFRVNLLVHPLLPGSLLVFLQLLVFSVPWVAFRQNLLLQSTAAWESSCLYQLHIFFVPWVAFRLNSGASSTAWKLSSLLWLLVSFVTSVPVRVNFCCTCYLEIFLFVSIAGIFCVLSCIQSEFLLHLSTWKTLCLFQFLSFLCHSFYQKPMNNWNTETTKELQNGSKNFFRSHESSGNYFRSNLSPDRKILNLSCKWVHQNLSKPVVISDYLTAWWKLCVPDCREKLQNNNLKMKLLQIWKGW